MKSYMSALFCVVALRKETLPKVVAVGMILSYFGYMALRVAFVITQLAAS